jgi:hypothetical protein
MGVSSMRPVAFGILLALSLLHAASAHGQQGCCACSFGTMTGCSSDATFCNDRDAQQSCIDLPGTFIPFTPGLVCDGTMTQGRCVAAASAPALSPRLIPLLTVVLTLVGYRSIVRRRASR